MARRLGRIGMTRAHGVAFAQNLTRADHVVVAATGTARAVAEVIRPGRGVIANPRQVRLIAEARIKADRTDATVLAQLCASGFLPEVPDETTLGLRRQVTRRTQIVRQWVRPKTIAQSILHAHLVPPCPHAALSESKGRVWLLAQALLPDEGDATARHLREHDRLAEDWKVVERELANCAQANQRDAASGVRPVPTARRELVGRNDGASSRRRSPIGLAEGLEPARAASTHGRHKEGAR